MLTTFSFHPSPRPTLHGFSRETGSILLLLGDRLQNRATTQSPSMLPICSHTPTAVLSSERTCLRNPSHWTPLTEPLSMLLEHSSLLTNMSGGKSAVTYQALSEDWPCMRMPGRDDWTYSAGARNYSKILDQGDKAIRVSEETYLSFCDLTLRKLLFVWIYFSIFTMWRKAGVQMWFILSRSEIPNTPQHPRCHSMHYSQSWDKMWVPGAWRA